MEMAEAATASKETALTSSKTPPVVKGVLELPAGAGVLEAAAEVGPLVRHWPRRVLRGFVFSRRALPADCRRRALLLHRAACGPRRDCWAPAGARRDLFGCADGSSGR